MHCYQEAYYGGEDDSDFGSGPPPEHDDWDSMSPEEIAKIEQELDAVEPEPISTEERDDIVRRVIATCLKDYALGTDTYDNIPAGLKEAFMKEAAGNEVRARRLAKQMGLKLEIGEIKPKDIPMSWDEPEGP